MICKLKWLPHNDPLFYITDSVNDWRTTIWCGIIKCRLDADVHIVHFILGSLVLSIGYFSKGTNEPEVTSEKS